MFELGIRSYDENPLGEATRVRFRCGCMMRVAGPGLVLRSCCPAHVPNESGDRVVLGALEDGPWLIDGPVLRMQLNGVWMGADQRNASLAEVMTRATDPEQQRTMRERQQAIDKLFEDPPNGGGGGVSEFQTNRLIHRIDEDDISESESQTPKGGLARLRDRVRRFAIDFWEKFEL